MEPQFDIEALFDEDYLYFYEELLTPERTERDADALWRLLELEPGMEILDAPCGHGRIANALAARGCRVIGLDITPLFLRIARDDAVARFVDVEYVEGDIRELPWEGRFDRVINWFTSFGYFDDEGNRRVLTEAYRTLRAGGRLAIDIHNRDAFARRFLPESVTERDGNFLLDLRSVDVVRGRVDNERVVIRDGAVRRMRFSIRMFTFTELRDWLLAEGFRTVDGFDWETGDALGYESRRMIVVATK